MIMYNNDDDDTAATTTTVCVMEIIIMMKHKYFPETALLRTTARFRMLRRSCRNVLKLTGGMKFSTQKTFKVLGLQQVAIGGLNKGVRCVFSKP
jgi:hypothetical protein